MEIQQTANKTDEKKEPMILDGKEVKNIRIRCSKHGDISQGSIYLRYTTIMENDKKTIVNNNNLMCMCCLNELYMELQKEPKLNKTVTYKKNADGSLVLDDNGDPIRIVESKIVYQRDKSGNLILDKDGNPIPEKAMGEVSVDVEYKNPDKPLDGAEDKNK